MKQINLVMSVIIALVMLSSCNSDKKEEKKVEDETEKTLATGVSGNFVVDSDASFLKWKGFKPTEFHNGTIVVENGEMIFDNGELTSGEFIVDMTTINVEDLEGKGKTDLENHLKGTVEGKEDHFFNVTKYPNSTFKVSKVDQTDGKYIITGDLTIRGITNPVEMTCTVSVGAGEEEIKLTSEPFMIDRTKWGVEFMSKSVFDDLKDSFIKDDIELTVMVKAKRKA